MRVILLFMAQRNKKGFTLLELMVSTAILLVALVGLLSTFVYSLLINETSHNFVVAANDAQYVLEQIESLPTFDLIDTYSPPQFDNLENETVANPIVTLIRSGLKEVTVNVSWTEKGRAKTFSLSTRFAS
ncbi:type II secretion system protein [bacterium]|nr:MAG: type II secretion system protein [bacterium]